MKTLYESIIQSRFGDHKIEESILDIDASSRLENDVKAGIKRQKLIQEVLKPVEDIIKMYHYSTQGNRIVAQDIYGLKGKVVRYEFESTGKTAQDKNGVSTFLNILKKAYHKHNYENNYTASPTNPSSRFTFKSLGISIFISFLSTSVVISLCYQSDNKQAELYIQNLVDKYTEPF